MSARRRFSPCPDDTVIHRRCAARGFTLVELVVVMSLFIIVIALAGGSFNAVLTQASKLFSSEESNIEGVVGLELFRHDITQAGYGLASEAMSTAYTGEAADGQSLSLNDPFTGPPRPLMGLERSAAGCESVTTETPDGQNYLLQPCSDYLALKGTSLGNSAASKRWTFLNSTSPNVWKATASNPVDNDSVVVIGRNVATSSNAMTLQPKSSSQFYYSYASTAFKNFSSGGSSILNVYGVGTGTLRMPFNRVDYFVATPPTTATQQVAAHCAPGSGILYKGVLKHSDGLLTYIPVMDCVAGMQVVLGWDTDGDDMIDTWSNADGSVVSGTATATAIQNALLSPSNSGSPNLSIVDTGLNIRNGLKTVKVYVLAQNGRKDPNYTSPSAILIGESGQGALTHTLNVSDKGWSNYRWKLYRIVVIPKNLLVNQ